MLLFLLETTNKLRCDAFRLGTIYVIGLIHNSILETIVSGEELHYNELVLEV